jgi:hypothetical protein
MAQIFLFSLRLVLLEAMHNQKIFDIVHGGFIPLRYHHKVFAHVIHDKVYDNMTFC